MGVDCLGDPIDYSPTRNDVKSGLMDYNKRIIGFHVVSDCVTRSMRDTDHVHRWPFQLLQG